MMNWLFDEEAIKSVKLSLLRKGWLVMPANKNSQSEEIALENIEEIIFRAIKKVNGRKENDLCKYLPMSTGGYMHHFTLRKMKLKQPYELCALIDKFINNSESPTAVAPKQRAARGSKKRKDQIAFTKNQIDRLLNMARITGDKEMVSVLSPKRSLASCKRSLIQLVRQGIVDHSVWNDYVESVQVLRSTDEALSADESREYVNSQF